jgi:hypothetical protein
MIRFALVCDRGHDFDAWFASGDAYEVQTSAHAVICPDCGSRLVRKAPMAPAVKKGRIATGPDRGAGERKKTYAFLPSRPSGGECRECRVLQTGVIIAR